MVDDFSDNITDFKGQTLYDSNITTHPLKKAREIFKIDKNDFYYLLHCPTQSRTNLYIYEYSL